MDNNPLLAQDTPEKTLQIPFCEFCSRLKIGHKWYSLDDPATIERLKPELCRALVLQKDVKVLARQGLIDYAEDGTPQTLHLQLHATKQLLQGAFQQEQRTIMLELAVQPCQLCTQLKNAHYEAVLQIRAEDRHLDPEESQWISQLVIEQTTKALVKNSRNYISRMDERPTGLDFYFGTASLALRLARELTACTAAHLKVSHKLVSAAPSLKSPKKRTTISLRIPNYRRGDFVSFRSKRSGTSEIIQVLAFVRGMVQYYSYTTNRIVSVPVKQFHERKPIVLAPALSIRPFLIVANLDDSVQLMDPQTYQTFEILRDRLGTNIQPGKVINAVLIDDELYVSFYPPDVPT